MLMISPDQEKKPLGIFLITRVTATPASLPVGSDALIPIPGPAFSNTQRGRLMIGRRRNAKPEER
jgi:hypothetical protein